MGTQRIIRRATPFHRRATAILSGISCCALAAASATGAISASDTQLNGFEGGGTFAITNTTHSYGSDNIQIGWSSSGNTVTISGSTLTTTGDLQLGSSGNHGNNHLAIVNGSQLTVKGLSRPGSFSDFSSSSSILISGKGSTLTLTGGLVTSGPRDQSATITVKDGGLLKMPVGIYNQYASYPYNANPIQFDGGFYAVKTDAPLYVGNSKTNWDAAQFRYWDSATEAWLNVLDLEDFNKHFSVVYYDTDEAAYAATGHWGLGGYSVVGLIPEPSTYATIFGATMVGFVALRRRRK